MLSTEKVLSKETPLILQWLPRDFGNSVPNNEDFPYLQRLVNWAEREPQRDIYLVVNGSGLNPEQIEDLKAKLSPMPNIKVVNFNEIDLGKNDHIFKIPGEEIKISKYFAEKYNMPSEKLFRFGCEVDLQRLSILENFDKITEQEEGIIYLDFDILPAQDGTQLGSVKIPDGVLMAKAGANVAIQSENSIIAVKDPNNAFIAKVISQLQEKFSYIEVDMMNPFKQQHKEGDVFSAMLDALWDKFTLNAPEYENLTQDLFQNW